MIVDRSAASRRAARLAKGYGLQDLAIANGPTVAEIAAAEDVDAELPAFVERIERALG